MLHMIEAKTHNYRPQGVQVQQQRRSWFKVKRREHCQRIAVTARAHTCDRCDRIRAAEYTLLRYTLATEHMVATCKYQYRQNRQVAERDGGTHHTLWGIPAAIAAGPCNLSSGPDFAQEAPRAPHANTRHCQSIASDTAASSFAPSGHPSARRGCRTTRDGTRHARSRLNGVSGARARFPAAFLTAASYCNPRSTLCRFPSIFFLGGLQRSSSCQGQQRLQDGPMCYVYGSLRSQTASGAICRLGLRERDARSPGECFFSVFCRPLPAPRAPRAQSFKLNLKSKSQNDDENGAGSGSDAL